MQTIKEIQQTIKKLDKQINSQKRMTKEGQVNNILTRLEEAKESLLKVVQFRTNPEKAKRCSLPKKIQRRMGLLPSI